VFENRAMRIFVLEERGSSRRLEKTVQIGRDYLEDLGIDERILLKFLVCECVLTGFRRVKLLNFVNMGFNLRFP
jgi:hypothetical protein